MSAFVPPVRDMRFAIEEIAGLSDVAAIPGHEDATPDLVGAILDEAGKFAAEVFAPLNRVGDIEGCRIENGLVVTPTGLDAAYRQFVAAGWNGLPFDRALGGQGLPWLVQTAVLELWTAANMAFSLCPLLTQGAVELLTAHGSAEQKRLYLPKLVTGTWTGTMNLTEPHAGSDVGALRTRAERAGDHYRLRGQKIFITWGDHTLTENIVHMVLARVASAPEGIRGVSLFIVPKLLVNPDGSLGPRNDLRAASLEHKMGIHGSPTAVMLYGENEGAVAHLVGEENRGIEYMFTMMNNARLGVGVEGLAIAERAYQQARDYARTRVQGRDIAEPRAGPVAIIRHPDVRRMLMTMKASVEAARLLTYSAAADLDLAGHHPDKAVRARHQARLEVLTPLVKAWCTDIGVEVASLGLQVHGGAGFIEETGAAQHYRDARIAPIYEGTNGIQALDLVRRKLAGDGGAAVRALLAETRAAAAALPADPTVPEAMMAAPVANAVAAAETATDHLVAASARDARAAASGATPYLRLLAITVAGGLMAKAASAARARLEAGAPDAGFYAAKCITARFFAEHILAEAPALALRATASPDGVMALAEEAF
ncbi:MAG: acyl-CoA dehydrogenase [Alphaproteobacteria bacterium]|nr:acyl-CoA dehydrogenase [Alphaproteobacteria bacterium]